MHIALPESAAPEASSRLNDPRILALPHKTVMQVGCMLVSAVMRAREGLATAQTANEREARELDLALCSATLDEFTQATRRLC